MSNPTEALVEALEKIKDIVRGLTDSPGWDRESIADICDSALSTIAVHSARPPLPQEVETMVEALRGARDNSPSYPSDWISDTSDLCESAADLLVRLSRENAELRMTLDERIASKPLAAL